MTALSVFGGWYGFRLLLRGFPARIFPQADTRKAAAGEIEIGKREEREHLHTVLGDAAIADLRPLENQ